MFNLEILQKIYPPGSLILLGQQQGQDKIYMLIGWYENEFNMNKIILLSDGIIHDRYCGILDDIAACTPL